ncbi:MAG: class I SAM-dependent methyltransferase [Actinomycetia bacterium]|nr:class I SAM-dependent methyltransferase [Actinomycetes bacterium]
MLEHKVIYNSIDIARDYGSRDYIEAPELALLKEVEGSLAGARMLDMGVGGGRTTKYFGPRAGQYIGADYAPNMVEICRAKYPQYDFYECDVRDMKIFADGSFDFVLFSYNGLDSFSHSDRMVALEEINRVLSKTGRFAFSSHNLYWRRLTDLFRLKIRDMDGQTTMGGRMVHYSRQIYKNLRLSYLNRSLIMESFIRQLRQNERGSLYDNSLNGRASVYYVGRDEQIRQLKAAGFSGIDTFARSGSCTSSPQELNRGAWIYYLCRKS